VQMAAARGCDEALLALAARLANPARQDRP
jgi:hypothetical protein